MRYLLCGINAKYIHSNLAIFCLKAYAESYGPGSAEILIKEYTINHYVEDILEDLYQAQAHVIIFSCYIWNISYVKELSAELKKVSPELSIWVGGPEVSYHAENFLKENPAIDLVMQGEGEEQFTALVDLWERNGRDLSGKLPQGPVFRADTCQTASGCKTVIGCETDSGRQTASDHKTDSGFKTASGREIIQTGFASPVDMDRIPFVYKDFQLFDHKIIYYETSRGCPFSCSYCLSSIDKTVRFRSLHLIYGELQRFLGARVPQVKFVDRTFNCRKDHAMAIWTYIFQHDNGITNFHFEISSDLLDEDEMALFEKMRPGLIQLEIGVQSTHGPAIEAIRRRMDLQALFANVDRVHKMGNIHQHLDLIAGLPFETYEDFKRSFNDLYAHAPDQLQLGFLKVLKGTYMEEMQEAYGLVYRSQPPYEVLQTRWISYQDILRLKGIEEMVETFYNSMQYTSIFKYVVPAFSSPFDFYETLSTWYRANDLHKRNHNRMEKYEILREFLLTIVKRTRNKGVVEHNYNLIDSSLIDSSFTDSSLIGSNLIDPILIDEMLLLDMYLREKLKKRPAWAPDQKEYRKSWRHIYRTQGNKLFPEEEEDSYDSKKAENQSHIEKFSFDIVLWIKDGILKEGEHHLLFDYSRRDPLSHNALVRDVVIS